MRKLDGRRPAGGIAALLRDSASPKADGYVLIGQSDAALVQQFYLSFSAGQRRDRFRVAATDEAIRGHCAGICWPATIMAAHRTPSGLQAIVEARTASLSWDCATLIMACPDLAGREHVLAQLLQLAVFSAGQRGCSHFNLRVDPLSWLVLPVLANMPAGDAGAELARMILAGPKPSRAPQERDAVLAVM